MCLYVCSINHSSLLMYWLLCALLQTLIMSKLTRGTFRLPCCCMGGSVSLGLVHLFSFSIWGQLTLSPVLCIVSCMCSTASLSIWHQSLLLHLPSQHACRPILVLSLLHPLQSSSHFHIRNFNDVHLLMFPSVAHTQT